MTELEKVLQDFVHQLRGLQVQDHDDQSNIKNVSRIMQPFLGVLNTLDLSYYQNKKGEDTQCWLLHEETDHTLAISLVSWTPGHDGIPHDHQTWGVVGGITGIEKNTFWQRLDDGTQPGFAEIVPRDEILCTPGKVLTFLPNDIHSIVNISEQVAVSLHVYGENLNFTGRSQFNPELKTTEPYFIGFKS